MSHICLPVCVQRLKLSSWKARDKMSSTEMASFLGSVQTFFSLFLLHIYAFVLVPVCFTMADAGVLDHLFHLEDECVGVT